MSDPSANPVDGSSKPPQDRFTTLWTGVTDDRAIKYAAKHGNSWGLGRMHVIGDDPGSPLGFSWKTSGWFNEDAFRAANKASDTEIRNRHQADTELDTGTTECPDSWEDATRGEKLRYLARQTAQLEPSNKYLEEEMFNVKAEVEEEPFNMPDFFDSVKLAATLSVGKKLLEIFEHLNQLVVEEASPGWDWKAGLEEQMEFMGKTKGFSKVTAVLAQIKL